MTLSGHALRSGRCRVLANGATCVGVTKFYYVIEGEGTFTIGDATRLRAGKATGGLTLIRPPKSRARTFHSAALEGTGGAS